MRILWFNWRDLKNPEAGGAEVFTHEVMTRLQGRGYDQTLFTSQFTNSLNQEYVDGIKIIRDGTRYSVYGKAKHYYRQNKGKYDLVVDEINARPFLTPKFVKEANILALCHQIIKEIWYSEVFFPLNFICSNYLERKWLSYYKAIPTITVSNSSKEDLSAMGLKRVFEVPQGLSIKPLRHLEQKEPNPTIVFLGRIKKYKLPHHAISAFKLIKKHIPNAKLWIIGDGNALQELKETNHNHDITFYGHVDNGLKYHLLAKAHLTLVPAVREGWGLVVTESNAMGTPVIGYDVPGLRDSIKDGKNGILVRDNSPDGLARSAISLLTNEDLLLRYSNNALEYSRLFSWDKTADAFEDVLRNTCTKKQLVHA